MQDNITLRALAESLIPCLKLLSHFKQFSYLQVRCLEISERFVFVEEKSQSMYLKVSCEGTECSWFCSLLKFLSTVNHISFFQKQAGHVKPKYFNVLKVQTLEFILQCLPVIILMALQHAQRQFYIQLLLCQGVLVRITNSYEQLIFILFYRFPFLDCSLCPRIKCESPV